MKRGRLSVESFEDALKIERLKTEKGFAGAFTVEGRNCQARKKKKVWRL